MLRFLKRLFNTKSTACKHSGTITHLTALESYTKALHGDKSELNRASSYVIECLSCGKTWTK